LCRASCLDDVPIIPSVARRAGLAGRRPTRLFMPTPGGGGGEARANPTLRGPRCRGANHELRARVPGARKSAAATWRPRCVHLLVSSAGSRLAAAEETLSTRSCERTDAHVIPQILRPHTAFESCASVSALVEDDRLARQLEITFVPRFTSRGIHSVVLEISPFRHSVLAPCWNEGRQCMNFASDLPC